MAACLSYDDVNVRNRGPLVFTIAVTSIPSPHLPAVPLTLVHHAPGRCAVSDFKNVALYTWRGSAERADTDAMYRHARLMTVRFPQGASGLHWIESGAGMPTAEAREGLKRILLDLGDQPREIAIVLSGGGFWASAVRSMVAGLRMAVPLRVGMRVGTSIADVMGWFPECHAKTTGTAVSGREIEAALRALIAHG